MAKPADIPLLAEFKMEGLSIQEPKEGMPSIYISKVDFDKAKANFSTAMIMRFVRVRPKLETTRLAINYSWGLSNSALLECLILDTYSSN